MNYVDTLSPEERAIHENVSAWFAGHISKGHTGTFYAALEPSAPLFYTGPAYCAQCLADAKAIDAAARVAA